jgi:hypothetical protein
MGMNALSMHRRAENRENFAFSVQRYRPSAHIGSWKGQLPAMKASPKPDEQLMMAVIA